METVAALVIWWGILLIVLVSNVNEERHTIPPHEGTDGTAEQTEKQKPYNWYITVYIILALLAPLPFLLPALARARESGGHYATIENNLRQWGLVFKMYANESPGEQYPPLTRHDNLYVPDLHILYPKHLNNISLVCDPSGVRYDYEIYDSKGYPDVDKAIQLMAQNYVYPGWTVYKDTDMDVIKRYRTEKALRKSNYQVEDTYYYWMREGVERFLITDINNPNACATAQSNIPVMIAHPRPEQPKRGSRFDRRWFNFKKNYLGWEPRMVLPVLFFDGHVEKIPLDEVPDHIKALTELFPEPIEDNKEIKNKHG